MSAGEAGYYADETWEEIADHQLDHDPTPGQNAAWLRARLRREGIAEKIDRQAELALADVLNTGT